MKKNRITVLTVFIAALTMFLGAVAVPASSAVKKPPKLILQFQVPPDTGDKNLQGQLENLAKIAITVKPKDRDSLSRSFSKFSRREIARLLLKTAELEIDECHKNYLETLARTVVQNSRFTVDVPPWVELEENRAEIIFVEDERYRICKAVLESYFNTGPLDFSWEKNGFFDTYIYLNDPEENLRLQGYSNALAKMQDNLPPMAKQELPYSPLKPIFKPVNLVFSTNPTTLTLLYPVMAPAGDVMTSSLEPGAGQPFKIIIFKNLVKAYLEGVLKAVAGRALAPERRLEVDYDSYISNIVMRRISHHLGPVFVVRLEQEEVEYIEVDDREVDQLKIHRRVPKKKKKRRKEKELKTIPEILKDLFPIVETIKADMAALHNTEVLMETGLISEDKDINIYSTYLVSLVDRLRNLPNEKLISGSGRMKLEDVIKEDKIEDFIAALIEFNHLLLNEAIFFDINSKTFDIDRIKFKEAVEKLIKTMFRYILNPTYENVESYMENKIVINPQLDEVLKKLEGIPLRFRFQADQEAWQ